MGRCYSKSCADSQTFCEKKSKSLPLKQKTSSLAVVFIILLSSNYFWKEKRTDTDKGLLDTSLKISDFNQKSMVKILDGI